MTKVLTILILFFSSSSLAQDDKYLPKSSGDIAVVSHTHYHLGYSENHEQAAWVAYELASSEIYGNVDRTEDFREDPLVSTGSASLEDYKGSGYDRGHLAPAADMAFSELAMSESFFLSNMSPQEAGFNRGIWKSLESQVRQWVSEKGSLYVVTGAVLIGSMKKEIGPNAVDVPEYYYKILYVDDSYQMIGFLMKNEKSDKDIMSFAVSVDKIEEVTGLDFFHQLKDREEELKESGFLFSDWKVDGVVHGSSRGNSSSTRSTNVKSSTSAQCSGIAKSTGVRCKKMTLNSNGYCHYHQSQVGNTKPTSKPASTSGRCTATTKSGTRCKRTASAGRSTCWQH
ncbi:DNA/RNA non-specific endonuclease [Ekhidna sp.]|uniref:DNA/RNA non-specific endonuclease n=1 Tax=Ekhidna sp. TaxID=2608089 RepID=UPI0032EDB781